MLRTIAPMVMPYWRSPRGWVLVDHDAFETLLPSQILLVMHPGRASVGFNTIDFGSEYVIAMNVDASSTIATNAWVRYCLGGKSAGLGPLNNFHWRGSKFVLTRSWFENVNKWGNVAKALLKRIRSAESVNDWVIIEAGKSLSSARDFKSMCEAKPKSAYDGFAELSVSPNGVRTNSLVWKIWQSLLPQSAVPYDAERRAELATSPQLSSEVASYVRLFDSVSFSERMAAKKGR